MADRLALQHPRELAEQRAEIEGRHDLDPAVGDLLLDLPLGQQRIEADHHAAGLEHGEVEDDEIGRVGQHEADARAREHPDRLQAPGGTGHQTGHVAVAIATAQKIEARGSRETRDGVVE